MWIMLFTVLVIAMTLLVMYKKEKNVLRRMMARGRCGLPGMPNKTFNIPPDPWGGGCEGGDEDGKKQEKDPFDSQLITLAKIIVEKRKQITDSKGRVNKAEETLQQLHITSISLRRKYQDIMDDLRDELESAELECQDLNRYIGKANDIKQKFFSTDNDDECNGKALPDLPRRVSQGEWGSLPMCSSSPEKKPAYTCHPPVERPKNVKSPTSCKCPRGSKNPSSTCVPPPPICCPRKAQTSQNCCAPKTENNSCVNKQQSEPVMGGCCSPSSNSNSLPCPPPLPSLLAKLSPECSALMNKECGSCEADNSASEDCGGSENCSPPSPPKKDECDPCSIPPLPRPPPPSCCPPPCPPPSSCCPPPCPPPSSCCPPKPSCPPPACGRCPPPPPCNSICTCCDCKEDPCPSPTFVRRPPFSSFLQERMPISPPMQRRSFKQTVVTEECIEGDEDETTSWLEPNTIVTEVRTSSVTFPPNCCVSAYEEFLNAALKAQPKKEIKLPIIMDECDPCAEVPREISPWEDIENVTHTCGTQTKEDEEENKNGRRGSGGRSRQPLR